MEPQRLTLPEVHAGWAHNTLTIIRKTIIRNPLFRQQINSNSTVVMLITIQLWDLECRLDISSVGFSSLASNNYRGFGVHCFGPPDVTLIERNSECKFRGRRDTSL